LLYEYDKLVDENGKLRAALWQLQEESKLLKAWEMNI